MKKMLGILLLITLLSIILTGCNHIELQSLWKDFEINIDGKDNDWDDAKIYIKEKNLVVAIANDEEFLYLCFYPTTNQSVKQVLMQGISLWFNTDGKKDRNNGISYPLPMGASKGNRTEDRKGELQNRDIAGNHNSVSQVEKLVHNIKLRNGDVKISSDNGDAEIPIPGLIGMNICMDAENGVFAYEAKIPLNDPTASYSLGIEPGQELMIGLRSEPLDRDNIDETLSSEISGDLDGSAGSSGKGGGGRSGGGRSGGGRSGGGKGGAARSGGMNTSSDMRFWANVKLAVNPN